MTNPTQVNDTNLDRTGALWTAMRKLLREAYYSVSLASCVDGEAYLDSAAHAAVAKAVELLAPNPAKAKMGDAAVDSDTRALRERCERAEKYGREKCNETNRQQVEAQKWRNEAETAERELAAVRAELTARLLERDMANIRQLNAEMELYNARAKASELLAHEPAPVACEALEVREINEVVDLWESRHKGAMEQDQRWSMLNFAHDVAFAQRAKVRPQERAETAERELAGARAEIDRWKDIAHTDAKAMEENARRIAARDANLQTLAKSLDTAERELAAVRAELTARLLERDMANIRQLNAEMELHNARDELAACKAKRGEKHAALRKVAHAVGVCYCADYVCEPGPVEEIVRYAEEGNRAIGDVVDLQQRLEAAQQELRGANALAESRREQLEAARVAIQRGADIEASAAGEAAGLPAVGEEVYVFRRYVVEKHTQWGPRRAFEVRGIGSIYLDTDEGKYWDRIPQPEKGK